MNKIIAITAKNGEKSTQKKREYYRRIKKYFYKHKNSFCLPENLTKNRRDYSPTLIIWKDKDLADEYFKMVRLNFITLLFIGKIYSPKNISIKRFFTQTRGINELAENFVKTVEGDYIILIFKNSEITIIKDLVGIIPLYYGENNYIKVISSDKKTLTNLDISQNLSIPPDHIVEIKKEKTTFKPIKTLSKISDDKMTMEYASLTLQQILEVSVKKRVQNLKEVAVAFSGGLDSSIIAFLCKKFGVNVHLIHVSLEKQPETTEAIKAAEELKIPLKIHIFKKPELEKVIPKVINIIEDYNVTNLSVGIPTYWTAKKTAEAGLKVLLTGTGADELFGGYKKYVNNFLYEGPNRVKNLIFKDVSYIHKKNIERDFKICNFHNVDLRLPFITFELKEFALKIPLELKFCNREDCLRKLVLRRAAKKMDLPKHIVEKPKKAVQYSTGVSDALKKIAKNHKKTLPEYIKMIYDAVF